MEQAAALSAFEVEVRRTDVGPRLDRAALLIAAGEYPELEIERSLAVLDALAAGIRALLPSDPTPAQIAEGLRRGLFTALGFRGNTDHYYDPRNSYLNDVLERRLGLPITLSIVYLEVARRLDLDAAGVSYPRHFLVKYHDGEQDWLVDPWHGGETVSMARFRERVRAQGGIAENVADYHLAAVTHRQILTRLLTNLKLVYLQQRNDACALRIQDYLLTLSPWSFEDLRDRGALRARAGDIRGALADLEAYLDHAPAEDAGQVRQLVQHLRAGRAFLEG